MFVKTIFVLGISFFTANLSYNLFQAAPAAAASGGIYSAAQAQRGSATFTAKCAMCHGATLDGNAPFPPLNTPEFLAKYDDKPAAVLFDKIQKTMPATAPGTLSGTDTADVLAFILSSNKYPAGTADLPSDSDSLQKVTLPKP